MSKKEIAVQAKPKQAASSQLGIGTNFKRLDLFGKPIGFKIDGKDKYRTVTGGTVSLLILLILTLFASNRISKLVTRTDAKYQTIIDEKAIDALTPITFGEANFNIAVAVADKYNNVIYSKGYVEWEVSLISKKLADDGKIKINETPLGTRNCTKADSNRFYAPLSMDEHSTDAVLQTFLQMICLKNAPNIALFGESLDLELQLISLSLVRCTEHEYCKSDTEIDEFLKSDKYMIAYYNN